MGPLPFNIHPDANFKQHSVRAKFTVLKTTEHVPGSKIRRTAYVVADARPLTHTPKKIWPGLKASVRRSFDAVLPKQYAGPQGGPAKTDKCLTYGSYLISTTQLPNGHWVASFGHSAGQPMVVNGRSRSVMETKQYRAEVLAIADAQLAIEDLIAGGA